MSFLSRLIVAHFWHSASLHRPRDMFPMFSPVGNLYKLFFYGRYKRDPVRAISSCIRNEVSDKWAMTLFFREVTRPFFPILSRLLREWITLCGLLCVRRVSYAESTGQPLCVVFTPVRDCMGMNLLSDKK